MQTGPANTLERQDRWREQIMTKSRRRILAAVVSVLCVALWGFVFSDRRYYVRK